MDPETYAGIVRVLLGVAAFAVWVACTYWCVKYGVKYGMIEAAKAGAFKEGQ